jgi:hypothetical protein
MNHDETLWTFRRGIWNEKSTSFSVTRVLLSWQDNLRIFAIAYLFIVVNDVGKLASDRAPVHETQSAFLDDSARTIPVAHQLNDKQPDLAIQLGEVKHFSVADVWWLLVSFLDFFGSIETLKVHRRVKGLEVLLVVSLGVELKNAHMQKLDVFYDHLQGDGLIDVERLLVPFAESQVYLLRNTFELL